MIHTPARGSREYKWNSSTNRWDPINPPNNPGATGGTNSGANLTSTEQTVTIPTPDFDSMSVGECRAYAANLTRVLEDVNNPI